MNAQDLKALRARVQEATGPDRAIDRELALAFGWTFSDGLGCWLHPSDAKPPLNFGLPYFTASLDAALTLCERVIPGASVIVGTPGAYEGNPWARICKPNEGPLPEPFRAKAATPALALLSAMLSALSPGAGEQTEEGR